MPSRTSFSKRNEFDPQAAKAPIIEDAPRVLKLEYWKRILQPLTYIDQDSRYSRGEGVLGRKRLLEDIVIVLHVEPTDRMNDSWFCTDELQSLVMDQPWYHFYDIVEEVARQLIKHDESSAEEGESRFHAYREETNRVLENNSIAWRLNEAGLLEKGGLPELEEKAKDVIESIATGFPAALQHLQKARRFVQVRPLDPENAIKEAISAVESYGRTLYPGTSTLGDVIKELRKTPFPNLLLTMMEKFYGFASSEPGVRHGGPISSDLGFADADFCLYVSVAFIDYLHKLHGQ